MKFVRAEVMDEVRLVSPTREFAIRDLLRHRSTVQSAKAPAQPPFVATQS